MAQLPPKKRKKRRVQLREAQRRRRARLKEESKSFLQIILSREMLTALRRYSDSVGKPLHASAAELIQRGLDRTQRLEFSPPQEHQDPNKSAASDPPNGESHPGASGKEASGQGHTEHSTDQMELFAGRKPAADRV